MSTRIFSYNNILKYGTYSKAHLIHLQRHITGVSLDQIWRLQILPFIRALVGLFYPQSTGLYILLVNGIALPVYSENDQYINKYFLISKHRSNHMSKMCSSGLIKLDKINATDHCHYLL